MSMDRLMVGTNPPASPFQPGMGISWERMDMSTQSTKPWQCGIG